MSMTREEAIVQIKGLKKYCEDMADSDESGSYEAHPDGEIDDGCKQAAKDWLRQPAEEDHDGHNQID